jgi:hypothetical protein
MQVDDHAVSQGQWAIGNGAGQQFRITGTSVAAAMQLREMVA